MSLRSSRRYTQIGLDRRIRLNWLERTASLVLAGKEAPAIKNILQDELKDLFKSKNIESRSSLDKTITILMKIWVNNPNELRSFRNDGLKLLSSLSREKHIAVHWGMTIAVYPFWGSMASHVGRLLRLQQKVSAAQVQRRLREQYGERETVSRRVRFALRSMVDWKAIEETSEKGVYSQGHILTIDDVKLIAWLVEALLHARANGSADIKDLLDSPSLFTFRLARVPMESLASKSSRLDILRHGLSENLVMLRESG